ncbi:MAG: hypothetical protein HY809_00285 [Nitrospirae bacterium]|nr:hypothetical protein [Nitrospirota bacterium]
MTKEKLFATKLCLHYKNYRRNFPWRKTKNPFYILISEIMLQKTDARKVSEVFPHFIAKYSSPHALSIARLSILRKDIFLLGIHDRANRLKKISKILIAKFNGHVPKEKDKLLTLKGVGDYITNAVLCFAFNKDVPIVDANVIRVFERFFSLKSKKLRPRTDKLIWQFAGDLVPKGNGKEYNRAILDFAALICTAINPSCLRCHLSKKCDYFATSLIISSTKASGSKKLSIT